MRLADSERVCDNSRGERGRRKLIGVGWKLNLVAAKIRESSSRNHVKASRLGADAVIPA